MTTRHRNDIPDSFREGMEGIQAGRVVDMDTALNKPFPGKM